MRKRMGNSSGSFGNSHWLGLHGGMGKYWLGVHKLSRELIEEFAKNIFAN